MSSPPQPHKELIEVGSPATAIAFATRASPGTERLRYPVRAKMNRSREIAHPPLSPRHQCGCLEGVSNRRGSLVRRDGFGECVTKIRLCGGWHPRTVTDEAAQ